MRRADEEQGVDNAGGGGMTIAVLGGTGPEGLGIAARLAGR